MEPSSLCFLQNPRWCWRFWFPDHTLHSRTHETMVRNKSRGVLVRLECIHTQYLIEEHSQMNSLWWATSFSLLKHILPPLRVNPNSFISSNYKHDIVKHNPQSNSSSLFHCLGIIFQYSLVLGHLYILSDNNHTNYLFPSLLHKIRMWSTDKPIHKRIWRAWYSVLAHVHGYTCMYVADGRGSVTSFFRN